MKRLLLASASLLVLGISVPASAADMAVRAPVLPPAPVLSWNGFYIGGHIGGAWHADNTFGVAAYTNNDGGAFMGGGQLGYNFQFSPSWLFGIEGDISALANKTEVFSDGINLASRSNDYLASITGRLGYVAGSSLFYIKGGVGFTDTKYALTTAGGAAIAFTGSSDNDIGYTVGGGYEFLFSPAWSAKVEYQYYNFSSGQQWVSPLVFPLGVALDNNFHTVKLGVNYHFNMGGSRY